MIGKNVSHAYKAVHISTQITKIMKIEELTPINETERSEKKGKGKRKYGAALTPLPLSRTCAAPEHHAYKCTKTCLLVGAVMWE